MYGKNDLRATLRPTEAAEPQTPFKGASYCRFYETEADETGDGFESWYGRGQNLIVAYSKVRAGAVLARSDQPDEYAVMLPERDLTVTVTAGGDSQTVTGPALIFVPPGESAVTAQGDGELYRLITVRSADLAAKCANAAAYRTDDPNVPPLQSWPDPVGGWEIRAYSGDVPREPGRFGRLYRCSTLMVNFGSGTEGPRDPSNLSPHHHDDFEQYSVATAGDFIHHLRWPWLSDSNDWRDDDHVACAAPSVAVIPPPAIHTSQGVGAGLNRLADVFCPPRRDFSAREGWVLNAADYPMPEPE